MPRTSTLSSVELDVLEESRRAELADPETPFRILVAGDFSGGAGKNRRAIEIDRDNFDVVMERLAPELRLPFGNDEMIVKFRELDDFHPDRMFQNLPPFQKLRELREGLEDGSIAPPKAQASASAADRPRPASGADLLRDMMGEPATPAVPVRRSDWDQMLHDIVAPYAVPGDNPRKAEMVAQTDRAIAGEMRAVLHHPKFQALEAAWRGLYFLVRKLETGETLRIFLVDMPREALTTEALRRAVDDEAWGVIAGLYYFEAKDQDTLREIAFVARIAGAPFIASLGLGEVGLDKGFAELRESVHARWIGLALPRFLLRLPYGKSGTETESFTFEELSAKPEHERYLWGNPSIACAYLLGEAFTRFGWAMRPNAVRDIDGMPAHTYKEDGEMQLKPCAEVLLTDEAAEMLLERGFIPLASMKNSDRVRVVRFQSVAEPPAALAGRWN
ncbi:MAG: type VI secretion system contractile sheath large subunit [Bryobacteraceae bacterium]